MNTCSARFFGTVVVVVLALTSAAGADAPAGRYTGTSGSVYDSKTKLTWQQTVPATTYTWAAANTYCSGVGATLGGTGWRLPTRNELLTIVDYSRTNPSIDSTAFPGTPPSGYFWSASRLAGSSSNAWLVYFGYGAPFDNDVSSHLNVRCVR